MFLCFYICRLFAYTSENISFVDIIIYYESRENIKK